MLSIGNQFFRLNFPRTAYISKNPNFGVLLLLQDLKRKEVINMQSCKSLGFISDLEIDSKTGCVLALIVSAGGKICWFFSHEFEFYIPWKCIVQIGTDIILVDMNEQECRRKCS